MGDVADQFLALFVVLDLLLRGFLQPDPHLLKVLAELPDLIIILNVKSKVQIAVTDLFCRLLELSDRP